MAVVLSVKQCQQQEISSPSVQLTLRVESEGQDEAIAKRAAESTRLRLVRVRDDKCKRVP